MHTGSCFLLAGVLVFVAFSSAYPLTISEFFDSDGRPASSPNMLPGGEPLRGTSGYAVPGGIELRKDITYEYYPVFGRSFSEIIRSAEENGPLIKRRNARFTSKTDWSLGISYHYEYTYEIEGELQTVHAAIDISDSAVQYDITITLPALNAVERTLWRNYFRRLLDREHGRVAVIEDADTRKKIEGDIRAIKGVSFEYTSQSDVERSVEFFLKQETQEIAGKWIKRINEHLSEYDMKTGYGEVKPAE
jgi:hypothetical protein